MRLCVNLALIPLILGTGLCLREALPIATPARERDRSPVDVVFTPDGKSVLTVNQTSDSVSLVDYATGTILAEAPVGKHPTALAVRGDLVAVVGNWHGELTLLRHEGNDLKYLRTIALGAWEPHDVALTPDGRTAYVSLTTAHQIAEIDLVRNRVTHRINVGRWPRHLALNTHQKRLAVGLNGDGAVAVVDTVRRKVAFQESVGGINLGRMALDRAGTHAWLPWMVYRNNPVTPENVGLGWVLANRLGRVQLTEHATREALSLDAQGEAAADPHGIALSPDERTLVCTASGTQELLTFQVKGLPLVDHGGPGDHLEDSLLRNRQRFQRVALGGRPLGCTFTPGGKSVLVANYLLNTIQEVDLVRGRILRTLHLGGSKAPTPARQGEALFYDARRSLDHWYSCASCHHEGHLNSVPMDLRNAGHFRTHKAILTLRGVTRTAPYFWQGDSPDLAHAVQRSFTQTLLGKPLTEEEMEGFLAYLDTLTARPNPYRTPEGQLTPQAKRGEAVFHGNRAGCVRCHSGQQFTDGRTHDVGTAAWTDLRADYATPSLLGVYNKVRWLHDGSALSLEDLLRGVHNPSRVTGVDKLNEQEMSDLLAYLRSLS